MKILSIASALVLGATILMAQPKFTDVYSAAKIAKQTNKIVYFVVISETCPHCQQYWQTLNDPEITELLNSEVVFAVSVLDQGGKVPKDLPFAGQVPITYLMKGNGTLINQPVTGAIPKGNLKDLLLKLGKVQRWN